MNNSFEEKVAIVTGASSGIGAAIVKELVKAGLKVVGLARRKNKMEELRADLPNSKENFYPYRCNVTNEEEILQAFKWIKDNLGGIDILINNAAVIRNGFLTEQKTSDWREVLETNVLALSICTRETIRSIRERGLDDGHIIHIGSMCGRTVPKFQIPAFNIYPASKYAVVALVEGLRQELIYQGSKIKISCVSPGVVRTEIFKSGKVTTVSDDVLATTPVLEPEDVAHAVMYCVNTPPHVHIQELIIKPVGGEY